MTVVILVIAALLMLHLANGARAHRRHYRRVPSERGGASVSHEIQRWPMPRPRSAASRAGVQMHGIQPTRCGIPGATE
jgi:hypothetical protein